MKRSLIALALVATAIALAGFSSAYGSSGGGTTIHVVAAENMWGSIAAQIGAGHVQVTSIVHNPDTDPHDYEPTTQDARTLAGSQMVIENGIGYDPWVPKLLAASPSSSRVVLDVGKLVGIPVGGNPHRWYSPSDVRRVINTITADYKKLDPHDAAAFTSARARFLSVGLRAYNKEIATIRSRYAGVKVGASESIFVPLAQALGLNLVTPATFLKAISEGTDPTAKDLTTIGRQISTHEIKVWVFNSQNSTPDVQRFTNAARKKKIPVTTITETLSPEGATFQAWQVAQLRTLQAALAHATGK